jgi:putative tricarboxylic transport membrane protein
MTLNRLSGLVVVLAGAVLLLWIIPSHTETVDSGWLRPATLPNITSIVLIITGLLHLIFPTGQESFELVHTLRILLIFVISLIALYLMKLLGFLIAAPLFVLVLMILVGERRLLWLASGIVLIPVAIWIAVDIVLNRPLP